MVDVIFVGAPDETRLYQAAGITSFEPALKNLVERVIAERVRCRVLVMSQPTFDALPRWLARELSESEQPKLVVVPRSRNETDQRRTIEHLRQSKTLATTAAA